MPHTDLKSNPELSECCAHVEKRVGVVVVVVEVYATDNHMAQVVCPDDHEYPLPW